MRNQLSPRNPVRRLLEVFLLTAAVMGIGVWAVGSGYPVVWQKWANWAFERQREQKTATLRDLYGDLRDRGVGEYRRRFEHAEPVGKAVEKKVEPAPEAVKPLVKPLKLREFAGRLTIPRLGMKVIVREGDDARTLEMAAGHIPGTAMPGQAGNVGIAGHRDTLLRRLGTIQEHDLIQFDSADGKQFQYEVESTSIHSPKDVDVLNAGAYPEMTLVTCYPFDYIGPAPKRFIVKARQLSIGKSTPPLILAKYEVKSPAKAIEKKVAKPVEPRMNSRRVYFTLDVHHARKFGNGISLGLSDIYAAGQEVSGWVSIPAAKRVVWLREQRVDRPFVFYGGENGARGVVVITAVHGDTASGWFEVAGT
jgi:sortase A